jgi:peptidoglycan-associated lipoprotein
MKKIILSIVLANLLAACASEKPKEAVSETPAPAEAAAPAAPVEAAPATAPAVSAAEAAPQVRSVYFPLDVDAVQEGDRATVQEHGAYLGKNPDLKVRVEGNCDERGSSEYNLGLGQRRADNVKKLLVLSGAKSSQIQTISFGKEKPRCTEHNEACWSQNRRADIVYISK